MIMHIFEFFRRMLPVATEQAPQPEPKPLRKPRTKKPATKKAPARKKK
jgi:hypothetical protein